MATKAKKAVAGKAEAKAELKKVNTKEGEVKIPSIITLLISKVKDIAKELFLNLLSGNKNFSRESLEKTENTSKRLIVLKEVINRLPNILTGKEETFLIKDILGAKGKASVYIADSLPRKIKGYITEKLEVSFILLITEADGKKVKAFTIRKAEKILK